MTIDKQRLQALLWAEVAAWSASSPDWLDNSQALEEFLGKQTLEEVALELLAENDRLTASPERQIIRAAVTEAVKGIAEAATADAKAGTIKEIERLKAECEALRIAAARYEWLRAETGSGPNIQVSEWIGPHEYRLFGDDLDRAIDAALGKGGQS